MKSLRLLTLLILGGAFIACGTGEGDDDSGGGGFPANGCFSAGDFRCSGNVVQLCNADERWEDYQNCGAIGEQCSTRPSDCSGFTGIACCN